MAVTLTALDLIQPTGELEEDLIPGADLMVLAQETLDQAAEVVESNGNIPSVLHNDAARAWAYARVYRIVANRLASQPSMVVVARNVTRLINADRILHFKNLSEMYQAEYDAYAVGAGSAQMPPRSWRVRANATW